MPLITDFLAPIRAQLEADIASAWGVREIVVTEQMGETRRSNFATIAFEDIEFTWDGQVTFICPVTAEIIGYFLPEEGESTENLKYAKADALTAFLEANKLYAGLGMNPHVNFISFRPVADVVEGQAIYNITMKFTCLIRKEWSE